jgi:hypothetical protein
MEIARCQLDDLAQSCLDADVRAADVPVVHVPPLGVRGWSTSFGWTTSTTTCSGRSVRAAEGVDGLVALGVHLL